MRFYADGPNIPDELISQQKEGSTIFFCGAGVSMPSGLPSFYRLTKDIIDELGSEKALEPFEREEYDRAFNALVREFGRDEIDAQLFRQLRKPRDCDLSNHKNLIDLSRSIEGKPRLVTTNFDLLFERAQSGLRRNVPPVLPNLESDMPFEGIVYLHGRLTAPNSNDHPNYIVSSGDFGRAYLSEGWATRFIKSLREQYAIVLVGYRAEDPPVRYLLEGLHSVRNDRYSHPIYTFTAGSDSDAEELWAERGVKPITYANKNGDHSDLWSALGAWADMVRKPEVWADNATDLAKKSPKDLTAHERGQVCYLISSAEGAATFSRADPAPDAEWLAVFDSYCRYAEPRDPISGDEDVIDPFELYHLDDDPPRPIKEGPSSPLPPGRDFLGWQPTDGNVTDHVHLAFWDPRRSVPFPPRLAALAAWFRRVLDQPATVWWAAGRQHPNPNFIWFIERGLEDHKSTMPSDVRAFWRFYLEAVVRGENTAPDMRWYQFSEVVKQEGWSTLSFRLFENFARPHVEISRNFHRQRIPPQRGWDKTKLTTCAELEVKVLDRHGDKLVVPSDQLSRTVAILRRSLDETARLMREIGRVWWSPPTLHPTGDHGERFSGQKVQFFLWFKKQFDRLIEHDPKQAKAEFSRWDKNDPIFFGRLAIYYSSNPQLLTATEGVELLLAQPRELFWDRRSQRELLFSLRDLWPLASAKDRRAIEKRIIEGPEKWPDEDDTEYRERSATYALSRLRWMQLHKLKLSKPATNMIARLKTIAAANWSDEWAEAADDSLGMRGGMVAQITESQGLEAEPVSEILKLAESKTEDRLSELRDYRPFIGLVAANPFRALSALRFGLRKGEFPVMFWQNLLSDWPADTSFRQKQLLVETIAALSADQALELRHYLPDWLKKNISSIKHHQRSFAFRYFDMLLKPYLQADADALSSGIGTTMIGGVEQDRSEVSINKAINSPAGKFAEALWELVPTPRKRRDLPRDLQIRFARLFSLPGDGGGHAMAIVSQRMGWLDYWYRPWVQSTLLPIFKLDHPLAEAAWHGLAYDRNGLSHQTLAKMSSSLLDLLQGSANWDLDDSEYRNHIRRVVALTQPDLAHGAIVKYSDARKVLKAIDDKGRAEAVSMLSTLIKQKGNWRSFAKPFLQRAWPKQLQYRGELASRAFANLLADSGDDFPDVTKTILPLVRPVPHLDFFSYSLGGDEDPDHFARRFPEETLQALDAFIDENRPTIPYGLAKLLDVIGEAAPRLRRNPAWRRLKDLSI